ncbi:DUF3455 domain-containing protein [Granulicella sibirica]|uniref:DUF3455 domain-containing protein n=1 Tax=Granulicella sibirica TaxID=2479048 RepID=A0A4Q0T5V6_9BACT|nr:DUF3455 domain-containing protein [Granulicella sibirica]RXH57006.1 hypothetical protein GRAN_0316 [Granulicella sibirica]
MRILVGLIVMLAVQAAAVGQDVTVPAEAKVLRTVEGRGVQIYRCDASAWVFVAPEAELFEGGSKVGTHGAGPVWIWKDGSSVKGAVVHKLASPEAGAVPWLLLKGTPAADAGVLGEVAWVRRWETHGGNAPIGTCEAGKSTRVEYSAKYSFYAAK